jgi:5-bromo-4-chloroindolyl phosphate hydrolysis protein
MDWIKFLGGLVVSAMTVVWLVSGRVTTVEADISHLKSQTESMRQDHDAIISMETDIKYIREALDDLRHGLSKGGIGG